eukprot:11503523-Karenia_brevis.AAC.1
MPCENNVRTTDSNSSGLQCTRAFGTLAGHSERSFKRLSGFSSHANVGPDAIDEMSTDPPRPIGGKPPKI